MILFFDTETTGLVNPRLVQLGMILTTDECEVIQETCLLVKPACKIEDGAIKAHGRTNEYCQEHGQDLSLAMTLFDTVSGEVELVVGHNIKYDTQVMLNEQAKYVPFGIQTFCTMEATTDILKLPQKNGNYARRSSYKWPKLEETYEFFFHKKLEGAHNALNDCRATLEIYKALHAEQLGILKTA
jgi:DNA polymerase III epsilon subunit-like protein